MPAAVPAQIMQAQIQQAAAQPQQNQLTRQARRLYVGGIPYGISEPLLASFFNDAMIRFNLNTAPGLPVVSAQINTERGFAFIEFRSGV